MNLPAAAALRSSMEQSNVPDDTPAHCGYLPADCTAPATVLVWIRERDVLKRKASCAHHVQFIGNAVTIVAVEEIRRAEA